jgi:hypothetical protein
MPTIPELLTQLDKLYEKEEILRNQIITLSIVLQQCKDDIEMMQQAIMYQSNKQNRMNENGTIRHN